MDAHPQSDCPPGASSCGLHLYVYYRSTLTNTTAIIAGVAQLQKSLRKHHCLHCGLLQRPEPVDGVITWMETYIDILPGFAEALEKNLRIAGLPVLIDGQRHHEYFEACLPCV